MDDAPQPLYLDYNATTPLDPRVFEVMKEWYLGPPANAGSRTHVYGQRAKDAVEKARKQVADVIGAKPEEILFTSGATESNNLAILGLTEYGERTGRKHIISTAIEHKAVLEPLAEMQRRGFDVELAPVTSGGYVDPDAIGERLRRDTLLVSVMHANNETGVLQPLEELRQLIATRDVVFHVDGAQTYGKHVDILNPVPSDLLAISGHKIYGPQGVGALRVRNVHRPCLKAVLFGGGQERGLRPGTVPVALVVGLGKAAELALIEHRERHEKAASVKRAFLAGISAVEFRINGDVARSQGHVVNVSFPGVDSEALMMQLKDVAAISNGSACTSSQYSPSHVLKAMGIPDTAIECAVRISWGQGVDAVPTYAFVDAVKRLRFKAS